jgi:hypothetical protein
MLLLVGGAPEGMDAWLGTPFDGPDRYDRVIGGKQWRKDRNQRQKP